MSKIYIENSRFKEFQSDMAEKLTRLSFPKSRKIERTGSDGCVYWTDEAQDVFNGFYDEVESMLGDYLGVYDESRTW